MKKLMKKVLCISLLFTCAHIGAMQLVKKRLSNSGFGTFVSNKWDILKLNKGTYTQKELNQKLFNTASIDPDKKISVIKKLIELGANVNHIDIKTKFSVLYTAIAAGHLGKNTKTITLLLKNGADKNKTINVCGTEYTPLEWAQLAKNSPAIIELLEHK